MKFKDIIEWCEVNKSLEDIKTDEIDLEDLVHIDGDDKNYYIHPTKHSQETRVSEEFLENFDGIVLEESSNAYNNLELHHFKDDVQYRDIVKKNAKGPQKSIFVVDMPYEESPSISTGAEIGLTCHLPALTGIAGAFTVDPAALLLAAPMMGFHGREISRGKTSEKITPYLQMSYFYTSLGLRSAAVSEKLEKNVPDLIDCDEPDILVEYGLSHLDIKAYLNSPKFRDKVLDFHSMRDFGKRDEDYLDKVCEYSFSSDGSNTLHLDKDMVKYDKIIHEF